MSTLGMDCSFSLKRRKEKLSVTWKIHEKNTVFYGHGELGVSFTIEQKRKTNQKVSNYKSLNSIRNVKLICIYVCVYAHTHTYTHIYKVVLQYPIQKEP